MLGSNLAKVTPTIVGKQGANARPASTASAHAHETVLQTVMATITKAAISAAPAMTQPPKDVIAGTWLATSRPIIIATAKAESMRCAQASTASASPLGSTLLITSFPNTGNQLQKEISRLV